MEDEASKLKKKSKNTRELILSIGSFYSNHTKEGGRRAKSILDSRFTSAEESYRQKIKSCGALTNVATAMLRHLGYQVKKIHGETDKSIDHTWIKVYLPEEKKWQQFDLTRPDGQVGLDYIIKAEVDDWEEIKQELEEDHRNYSQRIISRYRKKGAKIHRILKGPLKEHLEQSHQKLCQFFNLDWKENKPGLILIEDRHSIDILQGAKTEGWIIGFYIGNDIFVLDYEKFGKESSHRHYTPEKYRCLIKHELAHLFIRSIANTNKPVWLNEGVCVYVSGQLKHRKEIPEKLSTFLDYYDHSGSSVYGEAGFFVEVLVNKFGKEKLIELLKLMKEKKPDKKEFNKLFKQVYGFKLEYGEVNKRWEEYQRTK